MNSERIGATMTAETFTAGAKPRYGIIQLDTPDMQGVVPVYGERALADQYATTKHSCYGDRQKPGASQYAEFEHKYY